MNIEVLTPADIDAHESRVRAAAAEVPQILQQLGTDGLSILRSMKFLPIGRSPSGDGKLNLIEQVNQTFTYLVSLRATRLLMKWHPDAGGFKLALGTMAGSDIVSVAPNLVAAECFAATSPTSNRKIQKDLNRMTASTATHRYVFFMAPGHAEGAYNGVHRAEGVTVWAVEV